MANKQLHLVTEILVNYYVKVLYICIEEMYYTFTEQHVS